LRGILIQDGEIPNVILVSLLPCIQTTPWTPDNPGPNFGAEAGTDPRNLPTLFSMLPEQLGLRLEAQKEPIQILVIDKAEKPAANQN
jgi:uncharacterized protein (TIGR03435 family)